MPLYRGALLTSNRSPADYRDLRLVYLATVFALYINTYR